MNKNEYHVPKNANDPPYRNKKYYYRALQKEGLNHFPRTLDGVTEKLNAYYKILEDYETSASAETLALAFGVTAQTYKRWITGREGSDTFTAEAIEALILAYQSIQAELADNLVEGRVQPAGAIFMLKNHHGYKDVQQVELTPKMPDEPLDMQLLEQKYTDVLEE